MVIVVVEEWLDHLYSGCWLWAVEEGDEGLARLRRGIVQIGFATVAERMTRSRNRRALPFHCWASSLVC
jgi:hypothetical protein